MIILGMRCAATDGRTEQVSSFSKSRPLLFSNPEIEAASIVTFGDLNRWKLSQTLDKCLGSVVGFRARKMLS